MSEKAILALALCVLGYVGAVLAGAWGLAPEQAVNTAKDALYTLITIIIAAIVKSQGGEIRRLKLKMGM